MTKPHVQSIEMRVPLASKDLYESSISLPEKFNECTNIITLKKYYLNIYQKN